MNNVLTNAALIDAAASRPSTSSCVGSSRSGGAHHPWAEIRRASTARTGQRNNQPNQGIVTSYSVDSTNSSPSRTTVRRYAVNGPCACVNASARQGVGSGRTPGSGCSRRRSSRGCSTNDRCVGSSGQRRVTMRPPGSTTGAYWWAMNPPDQVPPVAGALQRATRSSSVATGHSTASSPSRAPRTPCSS